MSQARPDGPPAASVPSTRPLRAWQRSALARYLAAAPQDFLAVATPGAGKTTFALRVAAELLADRVIDAVTVVTPTEHLKQQWSQAAAQVGIAIDPDFRNAAGGTSSDYRGIAVTYAGVAAHPLLHRARTENRRTLVVLDEVHHAGDARSWGDAVREAFEPATRRLALTGTPFRSDDNPIPFVDYLPDADGALRSRADHAYGYAEALADGVVRPVVFLAYSGLSSWRTSAGEEITARLGEPMTAEQTARAWRTALDPGGEWIPAVLAAADKRLSGHRAGGMPDAGGLVIASDQTTARAYAADPGRGHRHRRRWWCCPTSPGRRRGSPGSPRPATAGWSRCGWSARASTCRGSRSGCTPPARPPRCTSPRRSAGSSGPGGRGRRRRCSCPACRCCSGWPASWRRSATTCWAEPHRADEQWDDELLAAAQAQRGRAGGGGGRVHRARRAGRAGPADLRGHLVLRRRGGLPGPARAARAGPGAHAAQPAAARLAGPLPAGRRPHGPATGAGRRAPQLSVRERLAALRKELNALVALHHHRTNKPHGMIHNELRAACGGPPTAMANMEQLEERIATLRSWR